MDRIQVSQMKKQASGILQNRSPEFRKTVLLHSAVTVAFLLLTSVVSFFLNQAMDGNQGLSGMGTTAILRTAQFVLTLMGNILLPFWEIGLLYTAIRAVRGKSTDFSLCVLRMKSLYFSSSLQTCEESDTVSCFLFFL